MASLSHAHIKPHASTTRLRVLVQELTASGCHIPLEQDEDRIDFDLSGCTLEWVAEGGIEDLFHRYADVVVWNADFYQIPALVTPSSWN